MSEQANVELLKQQTLLQEKLLLCLLRLERLERQLVIANEDRRAERAAQALKLEKERESYGGWSARDRLDGTRGDRYSPGVGAGINTTWASEDW